MFGDDLDYQHGKTKKADAAAIAEGGAAVAAGATVATGGTVAGSAAVVSLLGAAGISASVPVAGWIVAGVLATVAGTIAFVAGMRRGKMNRHAAVEAARKAGIPNPGKAPAFVVRVLRLRKSHPEKLQKIGERLAKEAKHAKGKHLDKIQAELRIVGAVIAFGLAEKRKQVPPAVPPDTLAAEHGETETLSDGPGGVPLSYWIAGAAGIGVLAVVLSRNSRTAA